MSRLERKCLITSAGAHALLALLLFAAPWIWVSQRQELTLPVLTFIPSRLVDGTSSGGGSPSAKTMPAAAAAQALVLIPPQPAPSKPQTAPPRQDTSTPQDETEPPPRLTKHRSRETVVSDTKVKPDETDDPREGKPSKRRIELSFARDTSPSKGKAAADSRVHGEVGAPSAQVQYDARVKNILGAIGQGLSSGTAIDVPGPGGEAYADYGQFVVAVYNRAWSPPNNLADDQATVEATVVIRRNGSVESFKVTRHSGHDALDKSVARLANVPFIAPFPEGALDEKRTFIIDFDLITKKRFQ